MEVYALEPQVCKDLVKTFFQCLRVKTMPILRAKHQIMRIKTRFITRKPFSLLLYSLEGLDGPIRKIDDSDTFWSFHRAKIERGFVAFRGVIVDTDIGVSRSI